MPNSNYVRQLGFSCTLANGLALLCLLWLNAQPISATTIPLFPSTSLSSPLDELLAQPPQELSSKASAPNVISFKPHTEQSLAPVAAPQSTSNLNSMYMRDLAHDDGSRTAFISTSPLNYQDEHGAWQPIDPRFEAMDDSFINQRNSFETRASATKAALKLRSGEARVGWEPLALAIATPKEGQLNEVIFAAPQDAKGVLAEDGHIINYADSWTQAGLSDEVGARAGEVEHSVIFSSLSPLSLAPHPREEGNFLTLRAALHLLPSMQLVANGATQHAAFVTEGDLEIRDVHGQTLWVMPAAYAYERANSSERVMARYRIWPQDASTWIISVDTPLAWWLDGQRNYPVVLDPALAVVRPTEVAQVVQNPSCNGAPTAFLPYSGAVGVGVNGTCGEVRALVRFNNLTALSFPPNYTIERAQVVLGATGGQFNVKNGTTLPANVTAHFERITSAWNPGSLAWPGPATTGLLCDTFYFVVAPPGTPFGGKSDVKFCDLQNGNNGIVSEWLRGQNNFGLMLKQGTRTPSGCDWEGCHFVLFPQNTSWTDKTGISGITYNPALEGSGFALVIHYRGPELRNGAPETVSLPTTGANYLRTDHAYRLSLSTLGSQWTAVGAKSVKRLIENGHTRLLAAGTLGMSLACDGISAYCFPETLAPDGNGDQSNFIVAQSGFYNNGKEVRVKPLRNNASGATEYVVEAVGSINAPAQLPGEDFGDGFIPGTGVVSYTFALDTMHVITAFNVTVSNNTRLGVKITHEGGYSFQKPDPLHGFLFRSDGAKERSKKQGIALRPNILTPVDVPSNSGGSWGLVLEYAGDITPQAEGCDELCDQIQPLTVTVLIVGCPLNAVPVDDGCEFRKTPTLATNSRTIDNYTVYSENGFVDCPGATNFWCTYRPPKGTGKIYTPFITWKGRTARMIAVSGESIRVRKPPYAFESDKQIIGFASSRVELVLGTTGDIIEALALWQGQYDTGFADDGANNGFVRANYSCGGFLTACFNLPIEQDNDPDVLTQATVRIDARTGDATNAQYAEGTVNVKRTVQWANNTLYDYRFRIVWLVDAATSKNQALAPYNMSLARTDGGALDGIGIASMKLFWQNDNSKWGIDFDIPTQSFTALYQRDARIQHDAKLGGAWNFVRGVILPAGVGPSGSASTCQGYCATLRANDGSFNWKMPDVNVNNYANTLMFSRAGEVQVFSTDHPSSLKRTNVAANFSFKTFGASVEVTEGVCPGNANGPKVTIVKGSTKLALPGLGSDTDASGSIDSTFVLCEAKLHEVSLTFTGPPDIPALQPPAMYVNLIGGKITLNPDYTVVTIDIGFYMGASVPKLYKGKGTVTIDTRGIFDIQAKGRLLGVMDSDGHLWVAWNPMDVGMKVQGYFPREDNWMLKGGYSAHAWRGRGWQNRYSWLPDNDEFHLTASYQATFRIRKGQIFEWDLMDIPPSNIEIGIELAFGQFCTNDPCTSYQWGIKGKVEIAGFDIGLYLNLECDALKAAAVAPPAALACFSFILGSDGHILIDQHVGASRVPAERDRPRINNQPVNLNRRAAAKPNAAQADEPLTITVNTGSFLVGLTWDRGAPQLTLVRPDNVEINAGNAASYGATISPTANAVLFGVKNPMAGTWLARISNATPADNYHLAFFANKRAPALEFSAPAQNEELVNASGDSTAAQYYRIQWNPPPNAANLRMSLYYSATDAGELTTTQTYGGVIFENVDPAQGYYDWDLSFLSTGSYRVYATLQDRVGANVSMSGTNQMPGVTTIVAPGSVRYVDAVPPPRLNGGTIVFTPLENGVKACWDVSPAHDLAGYIITYLKYDGFDGGVFGRTLTQRVLADVPYAPGARQCTRIGGLVPGVTTLSFPSAAYGFAAYDAAGNTGVLEQTGFTTVPTVVVGYGPAMGKLTGTVNSDASVTLFWPITSVTRYELFYAQDKFAGPNQPGSGALEGTSPITIDDLSFTGSYDLHGLPTGHVYYFAVRGYSLAVGAQPGPLSNQVRLFVTNGVDGNGDGCPDDWQTFYNAFNLNLDPDGDGLKNGVECQLRTNPNAADSDEDTWSDGEEVFYQTDPLDPTSYPVFTSETYTQTVPLPRLDLAEGKLTFRTYVTGPHPLPQQVAVNNAGGGALTPTIASVSAPWLSASVDGSNVRVSVNKTGLNAGYYSGQVIVGAQPNLTQNSPQAITVNLWVLAGQDPKGWSLYLPLLAR